ncbi:cyclic pyranopterin monophosphate synthase subunit MoaC [Verrucomicrobium sp. GAS474]|uniref:cyclic pyranopterin monophosphate synthase MoaC n=1 Tax=Verrucomicrobium sp. GAS474 TaxID=1882831 RepID=UPI00087B13C5|nr:cyclic pyranopterin monophosphate synthase MoaC [Verrucomicrobium sp. GAS474]SDT90364.1 cyclic pyranopterin monophosphate synthase subunit MoaC [Verrucomicrobium sp. GAS474]
MPAPKKSNAPAKAKGKAFSHLDTQGRARMVNVAAKPDQRRRAVAEGFIALSPATLKLLKAQALPKGDVLTVAQIAGIQAAKRTSEWIPLCHPLPLHEVAVEFEVTAKGVRIVAAAETTGKTGVEMEALVAVSAAALALYDMCKAVDQTMVIEGIFVAEKTKW